MKSSRRTSHEPDRAAFSLVEVVLALGVFGFAIVAILGVIPTGLQTSRGAQDETRAAQIAQSIFGSLAAQNLKRDPAGQPEVDVNGHLQLNDAAKIPGVASPVDLTSGAATTAYATNDGQVTDSAANASYAISIALDTSPAGFDGPVGAEVFANQVTLTVAWPGNVPAANQTKRSFTRVITKY